ncbi:MAG: adenylate/guanylate cyclase domain-containing protein [Chloroflexota bacterium]|nr:adenylate/guanylate cyclase domain-containing protein [Chloroflexota bacterium]
MAGIVARRAPRRVSAWSLAVAAAIAIPFAEIAYVLAPPLSDVRLDDAVQHFMITTNVSLLSAAISLVVLRSALEMRHWPSVLVGLGFLSLGGLFFLHGMATPGVLLRGGSAEVAAPAILALGAQLAMAVPAYFFAARYTPLLGWLERSTRVTPRRLLLVVALAIAAFDVFTISHAADVSDVLESMTGYGLAAAYGGTALQANLAWVGATAGLTVALLAFSAYRQTSEFTRTRLPTQAALAIAFLFQAEAQVAAVLGPVYSLSFWTYHTLLALATVVAIAALFIELDRRRGLERFLPATVVDRVVTGEALSLEGERRTATILFTDLRGSTALAERATPEATVATVNAYLRTMARAVIDAGGILDKFTGDGLMAIFGATTDPAVGAAAAGRAALRMRRDLAALNAERSARGEPVVGYGIGINTGEVVLGAVGLPERSDYTAMGDAVNTAARMESLTKELGVDVVVSASTAAHLRPDLDLRALGSATVRGKSDAVEVFALYDAGATT